MITSPAHPAIRRAYGMPSAPAPIKQLATVIPTCCQPGLASQALSLASARSNRVALGDQVSLWARSASVAAASGLSRTGGLSCTSAGCH